MVSIKPWVIVMIMIISVYPVLYTDNISGKDISFMGNTSPVNDNSDQSDLDIEVVGSGNTSTVFISYVDYSYGINSPHVSLKRSRNGGSSWDPVIDLQDNSSPGNKQLQPSMDTFTDTNGTTLAIVYLDSQYRPVPGIQEYVIVCALSSDNGSTWRRSFVTPLEMSSYPSGKIRHPKVKFGEESDLFVVWEDLDGDDRIQISYSLDMGANWSVPKDVAENVDSQNPAYVQWYPDVAADGEMVYVVWDGDSDWKVGAFLSKASYPSPKDDELFFDAPSKIASPLVYPMYTLFYPVIESDGERVHLAWWDFSTDPTGNNHEDITKDRPCIKYTSTSDRGGNWSVNGSANVIVNRTYPAVWHSEPALSVGGGIVAISWIDRTTNSSNVLSSFSTDNGSSWSVPLKANGFRNSVLISDHKVSIDEGGNIHCAWFESSSGGDRDIYHSRTTEDIPPIQPAQASALPVDEHGAMIMWSINTEPDFDHYEVFLGKNELTYERKEWPEGELYAIITDQSVKRIDISGELDDDTLYSWAVRTVDESGLTSEPAEGTFRTFPMNYPPCFTAQLQDIHTEEDRNLPGAINLSGLVARGIIADDSYNGYEELEFEIETNLSNHNISMIFVTRNGYQYLDLVIDHQDWYGLEEFRLRVRDMGKDGSFHTQDDGINWSNWFSAVVSPVNDPPVFRSFMDLTTGWRSNLRPDQGSFEVKKENSGCLEGLKYTFSLTAWDVDGDFISFIIDDPRFDIEVDDLDPKYTSIISFTPAADDIPKFDIPVEMTDLKGGFREMTLSIWVEDVPGQPFFVSVNGVKVDPSGGAVHFEVDEGEDLEFSVAGDDEDPFDTLELLSIVENDIILIRGTGHRTWNVTVRGSWTLLDTTISFDLLLFDADRTDFAVLTVVLEVKVGPPYLYLPSDWLDIEYGYDIQDNELGQNPAIGPEWGEKLSFAGRSMNSKGLTTLWKWEVRNEMGDLVNEDLANPIDLEFFPSTGELGFIIQENFTISVTVTANGVEPAAAWTTITIKTDGDDDNDGLPDNEEIRYFGSLEEGPNGDADGDGYSNLVEMMNPMGSPTDPTDPTSFPWSGEDDNPPDPSRPGKPGWFGISPVVVVPILSVLILIVIIIAGVIVIIRKERRLEIAEDQEIEKKVSDMQRRQEEINGLYGIQRAGNAFGPDQSTMDDLVLDLGGSIYHGGERVVVHRPGGQTGGEVSGGPLLEKNGDGPLFKDTLQIDGPIP
ncbi:MAG: hypothetical protein ACMUHU_01985 [Thermoplasmatota archaeon]